MYNTNIAFVRLMTLDKKTIMAISFASLFTITMIFAQSAQMANAGDVLQCNGQDVTIEGTPGPDELFGTSGPDVIHGLGGNDILHGAGDDDIICGGDGNDTLHGSFGNDYLDGGDGEDTMNGGMHDDEIHCSFDFDDYDADTANGGWGDDTFGDNCDNSDDTEKQGQPGNHPRFA